MPTYHAFRDLQDPQRLSDALDESVSVVHVVRPIVVHERSNSGAVCPCGCESRKAKTRRIIPHIDILIDSTHGERRLRVPDSVAKGDPALEEHNAEFDRLAATAVQIYMPHRCSRKQFHLVRDLRRQLARGRLRKVCVAFGGNRSGKTTSTEELAVDLALLRGGPGRIFMFVSPTLEKCIVPLKKLFLGDAADRSIRPMIDGRLVFGKPIQEIKHDGARVRLIDGTEFQFRHGNADGDNLKSVAAIAIFMDELCAIKKIGNWHVAVNRTMDTGGCVFGSTTPVLGHWAKEEIVNKGKRVEEADDEDDVVWTHLSCFDNPWIDERDIQRTIDSLNDDRLVRRDVYGEWVPEGLALWEYFDAKRHTFSGDWRPEAHGYKNITARVLKRPFRPLARHPKAKTLDHACGIDFNVRPMSLVDCMIVVREGADESDPNNWILWVPQEVVRDGGLLKFCDHLEVGAAAELSLPDDYFEQLALACDATGAQNNETMNKAHGTDRYATTLVGFFQTRGHDARPCSTSHNGNPKNPGQLDSIALMNKLMRNDQFMVHASRCKKLIHALEAQEQQSDGRIHKPQGKLEDKMSGPTDALRYFAWLALSQHHPEFNGKYATAA